jgi:hypothetical protein
VATGQVPEHDVYLMLALIRWATHYPRSLVGDADATTKAEIEREADDLSEYVQRDVLHFLDETNTLGGEVNILLPFEIRSMATKILPAGKVEGPADVEARQPLLEGILKDRPDAGGDLWSLHRALLRAKVRGEHILQAVPVGADLDELATRQLDALDGLEQRRLAFLEVASLLEVERFFDNATFVAGLARMESMPPGGPSGIGVLVPDDDRIIGPAFIFRKEVDDEAFQERWRPHSARWSFIAHPNQPAALVRFAVSPEVRDSWTGPWRPLERAFLFDPAQVEDAIRGFLDVGRFIWLVPESIAGRALQPGVTGRGSAYDEMFAFCLPIGEVSEETRPRSVEEALRFLEHWRRQGKLGSS